jgi:RNA polymerase sigma-70 factor (ECF subfamily)
MSAISPTALQPPALQTPGTTMASGKWLLRRIDMAPSPSQDQFAAAILPHLDTAYNLASWLMRNKADAEDVVQEAMLRALTYYASFNGTNARGWLMQIVRNTAYASLKLNRGQPLGEEHAALPELIDSDDDPETALIRKADRAWVASLLQDLPVELRETLVLRELQELSYKEISLITDTPIGTVMSRLWRGRHLLQTAIRGKERNP